MERARALDIGLWTSAAAALVAVVVLSLAPQPVTPVTLADKIQHVIVYTILIFVILLAAAWAPVRGRGRFAGSEVAIAFAIVVLGGVLETAQAASATRTPDALDAVANGVGVVLGALAWTGLRRWAKR